MPATESYTKLRNLLQDITPHKQGVASAVPTNTFNFYGGFVVVLATPQKKTSFRFRMSKTN